MAKIADGVLKNWVNGDTVTAPDYVQEREMIRTAVNDTDARLVTAEGTLSAMTAGYDSGESLGDIQNNVYNLQVGTYDKTTVDNKLGFKTDYNGNHGGTWQELNKDDFLSSTTDLTVYAKKDEVANTYVTKAEYGKIFRGNTLTYGLAPGAQMDVVIEYPAGMFSANPIITYSILNGDISHAYTTAHCILSNTASVCTLRVKNYGSAQMYFMIYYHAISR